MVAMHGEDDDLPRLARETAGELSVHGSRFPLSLFPPVRERKNCETRERTKRGHEKDLAGQAADEHRKFDICKARYGRTARKYTRRGEERSVSRA